MGQRRMEKVPNRLFTKRYATWKRRWTHVETALDPRGNGGETALEPHWIRVRKPPPERCRRAPLARRLRSRCLSAARADRTLEA